jgi:DNA replication protein DnaC
MPLLVMDDFGTQNATGWAQEKLFQIINYRYIKQMPLVVTTNLMLELIEPRIRSRLEDPELVTLVKILAPDYRRPAYDSLGSSLDTYHKYTFANFDLRAQEEIPPTDRDSLKRAFDAAREFAEKPRGWLVLTGPTSSGKTHLAAAVANYRADLGQLPVIWEVTDLFDYLRATFGPQSTVSLDRRFEEVKSASLLILDNLVTRHMSHWVREKVHQLFNYRYLSELPTVITTPEHPDEMDARILSRLQDARLSTIVGITAPPYRGQPRGKRRTRRR